jgi:selenide,water dikinase
MVHHARPKAGVFAVRQGKPLFKNLRRVLLGQPPRPFVPQKEFLILLGTGNRSAIASRGALTSPELPLLWQWKDSIDRKFMRQFVDLKPMQGLGSCDLRSAISHQLSLKSQQPTAMYCAGCGSKVGRSVLQQALSRIKQEFGDWGDRPDILLGLDIADDAAVLSVPAGQVLVQTVDYFRALVADPFVLGQITTHHCLNDLFAMGATPQSALAIATLPHALPAKQEETLYQLLSGTLKTLQQAGASLVGGHTIAGDELAFGLTCNGLVTRDRLLPKSGLQPGQVLILTKPLGTGTLFAADGQLRAKGRWIEAAIQSMLHSNQAAVQCFQSHHASACTDITGFGLVGHGLEMIGTTPVTVELSLSALPLLEGVETTLEAGFFSSLYSQNLQASATIAVSDRLQQHPHYPILFDPQTAGGLLAAIPAEQATACLAALRRIEYRHSAIVGRVLPLRVDRLPMQIME